MTAKEQIKYDYLCMLRRAELKLKIDGEVQFFVENTDRTNEHRSHALIYLCHAINRRDGSYLYLTFKKVGYSMNSMDLAKAVAKHKGDNDIESLSEMLESNHLIMLNIIKD